MNWGVSQGWVKDELRINWGVSQGWAKDELNMNWILIEDA